MWLVPPFQGRCLDSGLRRNDECEGIPTDAGLTNSVAGEPFIPDRSPGHAFVPIAHAGGCRRTKV